MAGGRYFARLSSLTLEPKVYLDLRCTKVPTTHSGASQPLTILPIQQPGSLQNKNNSSENIFHPSSTYASMTGT